MNRIIFIGTAGGRGSVFRLLRRSGGFLIYLSNTWMHVDPGPGAFVYLHQMNFDLRNLDLVVLSHVHLDHSSDINAVLESSTDGGKLNHVGVFAPKEAFEGKNRVILPFLVERLRVKGYFQEGEPLYYKGAEVLPVMKHTHHGADTYALLFNKRILYVSCALYEDRMLAKYPKEVDVMIINTTLYKKTKPIDHLSVDDAKVLIKNLRPKLAILTHFGWEFLTHHDPRKVAREVEEYTGVKTISAEDGMEVLL